MRFLSLADITYRTGEKEYPKNAGLYG